MFLRFIFPIIIMYIISIAKALKKMTVKKLKTFIFENYHQRMEFAKENSYYSIKKSERKIYNYLEEKIKKITEKIIRLVMLKNTINYF